ncbi:MAG: lipoprotein [Bacteroidetes bacterium]|nr:MAG: lipoprotein [Bacteroidota bacterium]
MKKILNAILFFVFIPMVFHSCLNTSNNDRQEAEFAAYVADYTQGLIPLDAPLNITLSSAPSTKAEPGSEVKEMLFSFNPEVKGKAFWVDDKSLRFIPDNNWPRDQKIQVSFFLNKLLEVPSDFHIFRFQLQTLPLTFELKDVALQVPSENKPNMYRLKGAIIISEPIGADQADGLLKVKSQGKSVSVQVIFDDAIQSLVFVADSIERLSNPYSIEIEWDGSKIGSDQKGTMKLEVPAKGNFQVSKVELSHQPEQAIHIWFSDYLDHQQNLSGMVSLLPETALRADVSQNKLVIYPQDFISGDVELIVSAGLKNAAGQILNFDYRQQLSFDLLKPQVLFVGKSTILAGREKGILSFQAVGLRAVDIHVVKIFENNMIQFLQWNTLEDNSDLKRVGRIVAREQMILEKDQPSKLMQWQTYGIDLNKLIKKDQGALYRVIITFKKEYAVWECQNKTMLKKEAAGPTDEEVSQWGDGSYYDPSYYYPSDFEWNKRNDPCDVSYYYSERFPSRNIIASNIGLMAVESNKSTNELLIIANNLETSAPTAGVKVELFDYQQQSLMSGVTDANGMVSFQQGVVRPFVAVASLNDERAYLKLDEGSALSYSRFDVSGNQLQNGIKGFVFTERGVYRPGDTLFIGLILKSDRASLPSDYPVVLELTNARQQLVDRQTNSQLIDGMCLFKIPTTAESPTGVWTANLKAGNASFSKRIRVETIKPNRLKINYSFGSEQVIAQDRDRAVQLSVNWLHGAKGANLDVNLERSLRTAEVKFSKWSGYTFNDPSKYDGENEKSVFKGKTDDQGLWKTTLQLPEMNNTRGKMLVQWVARVTEPGGDFSTSSHSAEYYPYAHYLGLAVPEPGQRGYLNTDQQHNFDIVRVDDKGRPTGSTSVKVEVFKLDWSWWWSGNENNSADYISTYNSQKIMEKELTLQDGRATFAWEPKHPQWGNFFIRISQEEGKHSTGKVVYVDWPDGYSRSDREATGGANLLSMSLDKEKYVTGEKAIISFSGPGKGKALISLENGTKQLKSWWIDTNEGENKVNVPLLTNYSPNIYVHITLLQPVGQVTNDMPVRSYGVASVLVEDPQSRLLPEVLAPAEVKTGTSFNVNVKEKSGKSMTYMLAVVDEGLLDLTNFKVPDPHGSFYSKEALGLKSWDMYDFVLGAYGGKMEQLFAIGGDESLPDREKARQSRFVPVVKVIGPVTVKAGKTNEHSFKIDNYIGSVVVMVVAVSGNAFGNASTTMAVKQPLMVLGTLPRLLRQKDEVSMPVTVFSYVKGKHEVEVTVKANGAVTLIGSGSQKVVFEGEGEKLAYFKVSAGAVSGSGHIEISAKQASNIANQKIELAVQNPNIRVFQHQTRLLEKGQKLTEELVFPGEAATHQAKLEVSKLPAVNLQGRLSSLIDYPHGCTEQITSQGFAQLYLAKILQIPAAEYQEMNQRIQSAIRQIAIRQRNDGSVNYWPGSNYVNEWSDIYAGHFMILASRENKAVPSMFLSSWTKNQRAKANAWYPEIEADKLFNDHLQAYRLYVLALQGEPLMNAMNRLREHPMLSLQAAQTLAAAYALSGQENAARELALGNQKRTYHFYSQNMTMGSEIRDKAMRIESLLLLNEKTLVIPLVTELATVLNSEDWLSTQTTAYALYAWQLFATKYPVDGINSFTWRQDKPEKVDLKSASFNTSLKLNLPKIEVENTGDNPLYLTFTTSGVQAVGTFVSVERGISLKVTYQNENGQTIDPMSLTQGTSFTMITEVTNASDHKLSFLALNQLIPAGWEIINERIQSGVEMIDLNADYADVRDDRVIHYFDLLPGSKRTFSTPLIATYEGRFLLPPVHCEAMYDNQTVASKGGGWAVVTRK